MNVADAVDSPLSGVICEKEVFNAVFTDAPYGIKFMDAMGRVLDANETCSHILGYSRSEMIGKMYQEITHPDDILYDTQMMNKVIRKEIDHYEMVKRYLSKSGRVVWVRSNVHVIRRDGIPLYIVRHLFPLDDERGLKVKPNGLTLSSLFQTPGLRNFMWSVIVLLAFNTMFSVIALAHLLHIHMTGIVE